MKKLTTILITLALALASCAKQESLENLPGVLPSDVAIAPTASIWSIDGSSDSTPMGYSEGAAAGSQQPTTRAAAPASFKVTAYAGTAAPTTNYQTTYFYDNTVNVANNICSMAPPQYFPANGAQKLYFYAYAPAATVSLTAGNATTAPIARYNNLGQTDILWVSDVRGIAKGASQAAQTQPNFVLAHKLMQLKFKIIADASFETGKTLTKLSLEQTNTVADLNVVTGAVGFGTQGTITLTPTTPVAINTTGVTMTENLLVQPATALKLTVVADGVTYSQIPVTITSPTMAGGSSHLITLTFKRNTIVPTASSVDWTTGGSADVGVI